MTAARRGHGEGSVYRDAANGTWVAAISLGWRPDGSRIRRKVTGRTKTEGEAEEAPGRGGRWPEDLGFLHRGQGCGWLGGRAASPSAVNATAL